ncbi:cytochrome b-c1 complex subunit 7 [Ptiloglossa arizonensis]|uniref:cytochrome b-c1 complex subunit 7 n=1 Tax=Ptiloglossa arizonensis TaxID=3350558 RepID=UPI003FA0C666
MFLRGFSKVGFETLRSVAMSRVSSMLKLVKRLPGCSPVGNNSGKGLGFELRKFAFNLSGYNKYGLYTCDVIDESDPIVAEALRRLPKNVLEYRTFRIIRAIQTDFLKIHLPKEKWITYEQDLEYRYLDPYLEEVREERIEIYEFGCVNYKEDDWPAGAVK